MTSNYKINTYTCGHGVGRQFITGKFGIVKEERSIMLRTGKVVQSEKLGLVKGILRMYKHFDIQSSFYFCKIEY